MKKDKINSSQVAIAFVGVIVIVAALILVLFNRPGKQQPVDSYEECVAAGGAIAEKFPPVCFLKDGRSFEQPVNGNLYSQ